MTAAKAFLAGFLSTLVFHQGVLAILLGAVLPTLVALFVVFSLKGQPVGGSWKPDILVGALVLNGAWGLGVAVLMRIMGTKSK